MKKTKSRHHRYPATLKRQIAREYLSGKFSYAVAAEEYGLKDKSVVKEFVRWYKKRGNIEGMETSKSSKIESETGPNLDQVKELESKLAAAQLRISSLETLIDLAESELSIDIRKKSGTKQSK